jgi:hypothetical protein
MQISRADDACDPGARRVAVRLRIVRNIAAIALFLCCAGMAHGQTCVFNGSVGGITFAPFDPSNATPKSAFTDFKVRCVPAGFTPTWTFAGANGSSPYRMKHTVQNAFIRYSVTIAFLNNTGANQNWRLTANVLGQDYADALVGNYSDLLTARVLP